MFAQLLAATLVLAPAAPAHPATDAPTRQQSIHDDRGDQHHGGAWADKPASRGASDLHTVTYAVDAERTRLDITYRLGGLVPAGAHTYAQLGTSAVVATGPGKTPPGEEFDVTTDVRHGTAGTVVFLDRTVSCHRTTTTVRPRHDAVVSIPLSCLPRHSRLIYTDADDTVYVRPGYATVGRDHTRTARWSLRLRR